MKAILIIAAVLTLCSGCVVDKGKNSSSLKDGLLKEAKRSDNKQIIGGWYPIFFDTYDQLAVNSIIDSIKDGLVKRIIITYDSNKKLAGQIKENIQKELNFAVMLKQVKTKDTKTVQYEHDRVVVTVYR
jgi:endonuclease G, mitochondrial